MRAAFPPCIRIRRVARQSPRPRPGASASSLNSANPFGAGATSRNSAASAAARSASSRVLARLVDGVGLRPRDDQDVEAPVRRLRVRPGIKDRAIGETHRNRQGMIAVGLGAQAQRTLVQIEAAGGEEGEGIGKRRPRIVRRGARQQADLAERKVFGETAIGGIRREARRRQQGDRDARRPRRTPARDPRGSARQGGRFAPPARFTSSPRA